MEKLIDRALAYRCGERGLMEIGNTDVPIRMMVVLMAMVDILLG